MFTRALIFFLSGLTLAQAKAGDFDINSPADNILAWVKLDGDTSGKEVYRYGRLVAYGMPTDKLSEALFEMISIRKVVYRKLSNGDYQSQQWACGLYADAKTREFIDKIHNPYTGENVKVKPFCSNISGATYSVEKGISSRASFAMTSSIFNKPYLLDWHIVADTAVVNRRASTRWTEKSSGKTKLETSIDTYTAKLSDLTNPELSSVNAAAQYTLATEWMTVLNMADHPGSMLWVGSNTKHFNLDDIPPKVIQAFEQRLGKDILAKPLKWDDKEEATK